MTISEIFAVLQIKETHEERLIRDAYHRLLTGVNPEDDPEGFKRLRKAYEEAVAYARTPEEDGNASDVDWLQDQALGPFLQQLDDIYRTFPRRMDLEEWKGLLSDPVFSSLEDGETAKWKLFSYLAEHFRVPYRLWKLLDAEFFIQENQQEMREHLPEAFVDYILRKLTGETERSSFPYEKLTGRPDADSDGFFQAYMRFLNDNFEQTPKGRAEKERRLEELASYGVSHPWYELDRAEYLAECGETEPAAELVRTLIEENQTDEHIWLNGARIIAACGEHTYASGIWAGYLHWEDQTRYGRYQALLSLAREEFDGGRLERAKQLSDEARSFRNTDEVLALQEQIHRSLIDQYTGADRELTEEEVLLLGRCYVQTQQNEEGLAFFRDHPEYVRDTAGWHKQMAILNLSAGHFQETRKETEAWRRCLMREAESRMEETEPDEHLTEEIALSAHVEARAFNTYYAREKERPDADPEQLKDIANQAMEWHDWALEFRPENVDFLMHKLVLLRDMQEDRKVIDLCEQIVKIDPDFFWPYSYMQEAYEHLRMAQQVVDTFYRAKAVYAGNSEIYIRAVQVFLDFRQYQDALNIIGQAEESHAMNPKLFVLKVRAGNRLVEHGDQKALEEADAYTEQIIQKLTEEQADDENLAELYRERAYLNEKYEELQEEHKERILSYLTKSLELKDTVDVRYFLGRYYMEFDKDPEKAFEHLKLCEERGMEFEWMYFYIARCHEQFKEPEKALSYYEKVLEINPDFRNVRWRIGLIWRNKFTKTLRTEYADKALYYLDQQEERFGVFTDLHRWRSYIRLCLCEYDKALEEAQKGLDREEDSGLYLLKGRALRKLDRYEESIESFEKSIACRDRYGSNDKFCYKKIFQCFLNQQKFREGIAYFERVMEQDQDGTFRDFCLEHMADLAFILGEHDRALRWIEQWYGSLEFKSRGEDTWARTADRIGDVLSVQLLHREHLDEAYLSACKDAALLADQAAADEEALPQDRADMCRTVGSLFFYLEDWETADTYFQKAYRLSRSLENYDDRKDLLLSLMMTCHWRKDLEQARRYGELYRTELEADFKDCSDLGLSMEEFLTSPGPDAKSRLYTLFCYAYYTGQYDRARAYVRSMCAQSLCWWCHEGGCTEEWEAVGMLHFLDGKYEEARTAFENANRTSWLYGTKQAMMMLRVLERV